MRVASGFRGRESSTVNLEFKPADPTCNPYLALSGLICAGLAGIDGKLEPGKAMLTDPALLSPKDRKAMGIVDYPKDLGTAIAALERDDVLVAGLGDKRVADYATMKRAEIKAIESLGDGGEESAYKFRF